MRIDYLGSCLLRGGYILSAYTMSDEDAFSKAPEGVGEMCEFLIGLIFDNY